jgi:RNA polymerase sigma factor (sigma-70 family)
MSQQGLIEELADAALIHRFLDGDELAFRALYRRHASRLRAIVLRLLGGRRNEADDVLQDAWLAACRALRGYRGDAKFSTLLIAIAIRTARRRLDLSNGPDADLPDDLIAPPGTPVAEAIDLDRAMVQLPDGQRAVVLLHDVEGFTHEEIGRLLGMAAGTSRSLLTRGRRSLRRFLTTEVHDGSPQLQ